MFAAVVDKYHLKKRLQGRWSLQAGLQAISGHPAALRKGVQQSIDSKKPRA
jgi:hypothetical protein